MYKAFFVFLVIMLLIPIHIHAKEDNIVEVYDIEHDKIISTLPVNTSILSITEMYLENINDIYKKFKPMPQKGKLVRVPLEQSISLTNDWVQTSVSEVIFIIPSNDSPLLLIFDKNNTPYFFTFDKSIDHLLEELDLEGKS
ncbi:hypothetical protein [Halalkalibacter alkaliphilus]|uniref:Uncharacterized protein n=1 Tax=Halalkalibacter alkaliphilus TaxID=2917993 RepID=A0A9X2I6K8_9BACI|nr:hypothetical protein [Halalkalibacter alkaliphilus]MCL7748688.1 hypothetical protein [Halalkalibacter alkaliphilus]